MARVVLLNSKTIYRSKLTCLIGSRRSHLNTLEINRSGRMSVIIDMTVKSGPRRRLQRRENVRRMPVFL